MKRILSIVFCFAIGCQIFAQVSENTVGLLSYDQTRSYQGYTMIYPHNQPNVYLLDNCGEIVHMWPDSSNFRPANTAYLLSNGNLVKTKRDMGATGSDPIWAGGGGATVEVVNWDNELLHSYTLNDENARLHHDVAVTPEGTVLMIAWEHKTREEAIQAGRDSMTLDQNELWPEMVLEWDPLLDSIIWEWHIWDHLVQDFDDTKDNFGSVGASLRKVDINYFLDGNADWQHANSIDYNAELDQIMLSIPYFDEIWIIDHSTTTEEATGSLGGDINHGGDLLWRTGNPRTYDQGDSTDQILFFQHDAHWTNEFIDITNPNHGKVVCFNNRLGDDYSAIEIFDSSWDMYTNDYETFQGAFPPFELNNTITHPDTTAFYSTGLSSAQILPNGNILGCAGRFGYIIELTPSNELVWEYITPRVGVNAATQGDTLVVNNNLTFRAFRYPPEYSAFEGRDLSPKGWIELNPNEDYCDRLVSTFTPDEINTALYPNPADQMLHLTWDSGEIIEIEIIDLLGRKLISTRGNGGMKYIDVSRLSPNVYLVAVNGKVVNKMIISR